MVLDLQKKHADLNNEVNELKARNAELDQKVGDQVLTISTLRDLVGRIQKAPSPQGESCRGDALRHVQRHDDDDNNDPSANQEKERELVDLSNLPVTRTSGSQGESSMPTQDKEKGKAVEEESSDEELIDALYGLDEDDLKFDFEDELDQDETEEGELIPDDIPDWKSDDEVIVDEDDDVNENIIQKQPVTEVYVTNEQVPINLDLLRSAIEDEAEPDISEMPDRELTREERKFWWFKKEEKKKEAATLKKLKVPNSKNLTGGILSWFFDSELQLFVLKRRDGLQYLNRTLKSFSSLPKIEVKELAWKSLINLGDDPYAEVIARIIRREGRSGKFELIKPRKGKREEDVNRIDPLTGRPWSKMVYKPVKCLKKVPLKTMPLDVLTDMKWWYVDNETAEAIMENEKEEVLLKVYDPLHLVNLSKGDLIKLNEQKIFYHEGWRSEAMKFQRIVKVCIDQDLFANCNLYVARTVSR